MIQLPALNNARWSDLAELQPEHTKTWIERNGVPFASTEKLNLYRWLDEGVMELDLSGDAAFMKLVDNYAAARATLPKDRSQRSNFWNGWHYPTPYMVCPPILDLGLSQQIVEPLNLLLNENALLHLALTGWVSTERNWHQDSYLNPPNVWSSYVAAWIALDDIDDDAGPFEYVPGSHRWEVLRREKIFKFIPGAVAASPEWPSITQGEVARVCEGKIRSEGRPVVRYTPKKGRVLFWHSNLMHRGTEPKNSELLRKALILHYSGVSVRTDMHPIERFERGFYFKVPKEGSNK